VVLFVRDLAATKALAEEFGVVCSPLGGVNFAEYDIVINATPLGLQGEQERETPATTEQLRGVRLAYDLVYNPMETRFLREASAAGCATLSGIEMLLAQARQQFKLWMGYEPEVNVMRSAALGALPKSYQ
jgi:shikimate dehydrogenase